MRTAEFKDDRRVTVVRADGTTYKTWESENLILWHKWTSVEVRVMQASRR